MILTGKVSNDRGAEKSNWTWEEQHLVSFLKAAELDHSVAETPPKNVHSFMRGVGGVFHDGQLFSWHPLLLHLLQGGQPRADNRTCFPDQFI